AAVMGAPYIRIFAGSAPAGMSRDQAKELCISAIEECCDYASGKGIFLGLENHGGIVSTAEEILEIIRAVKSPWIGINLDTGNFHTDDPYADLARIAPFAVNVQIKAEIRPKAAKADQPADFGRLIKILRDANYQRSAAGLARSPRRRGRHGSRSSTARASANGKRRTSRAKAPWRSRMASSFST